MRDNELKLTAPTVHKATIKVHRDLRRHSNILRFRSVILGDLVVAFET